MDNNKCICCYNNIDFDKPYTLIHNKYINKNNKDKFICPNCLVYRRLSDIVESILEDNLEDETKLNKNYLIYKLTKILKKEKMRYKKKLLLLKNIYISLFYFKK